MNYDNYLCRFRNYEIYILIYRYIIKMNSFTDVFNEFSQ